MPRVWAEGIDSEAGTLRALLWEGGEGDGKGEWMQCLITRYVNGYVIYFTKRMEENECVKIRLRY